MIRIGDDIVQFETRYELAEVLEALEVLFDEFPSWEQLDSLSQLRDYVKTMHEDWV